MRKHFVFIIIFLAQTCFSLKVTKTVPNRVGGRYSKFERFGFDAGGTIEMSGTQQTRSLWPLFAYICDEIGINDIKIEKGYKKICDSFPEPAKDSCFVVMLNSTSSTIKVNERQLYYFAAVDCSDSGGQQAQVSYNLLSTGDGNQVSFEMIPLPTYYVVVTIVWALILFGWAFLYIKGKEGRTPLHLFIMVSILIKLSVTTITIFYWMIYSSSGIRVDLLYNAQSFMYALSETSFFCSLYLISRGWRITRAGIPAAELRSTVVALLVLLCTLLFFSFYNTEYYYLSLIIMYFFIVPKIFTSLSHNSRTLDSNLHVVQQRRLPAEELLYYTSRIEAKIQAFSKARNFLVIYLVSMLANNTLLKVLISWDYIWMVAFLDELFTMAMFSFTFWRFRPSKYIFFTRRTDMLPFVAIHNLSADRDNGAEEGIEEWDLSKTIVVEWPQKDQLALAYEEAYEIQQEQQNTHEN